MTIGYFTVDKYSNNPQLLNLSDAKYTDLLGTQNIALVNKIKIMIIRISELNNFIILK